MEKKDSDLVEVVEKFKTMNIEYVEIASQINDIAKKQ